MAGENIRHSLSFAVRFLDHFSGASVADELPVRLAGSFQRPVARRGTSQRRHADGAYRFLSVPVGAQRILWREPFQRTQSGWGRWDGGDPEVRVPIADPTSAIEIELWPTAAATAPATATGVRGKLIGTGAGGLTVRIAHQSAAFDRFTQTEPSGEFLFLPPGVLAPDATTGGVPLKIEVRNAGGAPRAVTGGHFLPPAGGSGFAGQNFSVVPQTVPRVLFQLA